MAEGTPNPAAQGPEPTPAATPAKSGSATSPMAHLAARVRSLEARISVLEEKLAQEPAPTAEDKDAARTEKPKKGKKGKRDKKSGA